MASVVQTKYSGGGVNHTFDNPIGAVGRLLFLYQASRDLQGSEVALTDQGWIYMGFCRNTTGFERAGQLYYKFAAATNEDWTLPSVDREYVIVETDATVLIPTYVKADTQASSANMNCGGVVNPTTGDDVLLIGFASVGASDQDYDSMPHPITPYGGVTEHEERWNSFSPLLWVGSQSDASASGSYTVGGTNARPRTYCGITAVVSSTPPTPEPDPGIDVGVSDPEGTFIASIPDAFDKNIQIEYNAVGAGSFKLSRHSVNATPEILKPGNIVSVTIPRIDPDPLFSFFLEDEGIKLISSDEEGGEVFAIEGRGALCYPERAVWQARSFTIPWWISGTPGPNDIGQIEVAASPATQVTYNISGGIVVSKGSLSVGGGFNAFYDQRRSFHFDPADGYPANFTRLLIHLSSGPHAGTWLHLGDDGQTDHFQSFAIDSTILLTDISPDTPGTILHYLYAEATSADRPIHPTPLWQVDFTATHDSDGVPWAVTDALAGMTADLGEDYWKTIQKLIGTGVIDVEMGPDLVMHAWNAPHGRDLTSMSFAADKVRFVKAVNIADELERNLVKQPVGTWAEIIGQDDTLAYAELPDAATRIPRELSLKGESSDPASLEALGLAELQRQLIESDGTRFLVTTNAEGDDDDELNGRYLPGFEGTDHGKYWVGDVVTLHTGTADHDFENSDETVGEITIAELDNAALEITVGVGGVGVLRSPGDRRDPVVRGVGVSGNSAGDPIVEHSESLNRNHDGAHTAAAIEIVDVGGDYTATNVEAALAEVMADVIAAALAIANHLADTVDAHDAEAVSVVPFGSIAATNVQDALEEIVAEMVAGAALDVTDGTTTVTPTTELEFGAGFEVTDQTGGSALVEYTPPAFPTLVSGLAVIVDGGGAEISTGVKAYVTIPFDCNLVAIRLLADQDGDVVVDIWADDFASYPPADADSITGGNEPELSGADTFEDTTFTSYTQTSFVAGDVLAVNIDSVADIERLTVELQLERT